MKRLLIIITLTITSLTSICAQNKEQTLKGKWLIEANTNFGSASSANTSIQYTNFSDDKGSILNLGAEAGYFIMDDLALKIGLGYGSVDTGKESKSLNTFSYKIGAKYYIKGIIPFQINYNGASVEQKENPSYFGIQGGYAIFLGNTVSIEPGLGYDFSLNDNLYSDVFQFNIGFAIHL
ncbi:hypothetical protein [Aquimarina muelleri]|uniref:Outer membrane protein beta-barrel domain-containing protein n=1 Tax=Aquimarina muelleri TaxID=279356 RepID=A0A918JSA6_9FLAO|nr:hypothetical protein [Aquimarina muelleri]MCX2763034.1 hypothetical protein [Aquimarina muelleri]GGX03297.1 hypothetical protein GCM10007384_01300 [Aquimarina muelleri]